MTPESTAADAAKRAREAAVRCLARREYGYVELRQALEIKGHDRSIVQSVVDELRNQGLQNDERFAVAFVRGRVGKGCGPTRIRMELAQKGVAESVVDAALELSEIDWSLQILRVKEKKFGKSAPKDPRQRAQQWRFLNYKGFTHDQIRNVLE